MGARRTNRSLGQSGMRLFAALLTVGNLDSATGASRRVRVEHIAPFVGRHSGGQLVNITGKGFVIKTSPKCRFGAMEVVATVLSPSYMQCYTPQNADFGPLSPYKAQDKVLEVSLNGVDWTSSHRTFTFYDSARVFVSFLEPQGGPLAGGTKIVIHGSSFRRSEHTKCSWEDPVGSVLKADATYVDYNTMKCISPVAATSQNYSIEITLDDHQFTDSQRRWTYYDPASLAVSAIDPIGGPTHGGTLIEVLGTGFARLGGAIQHGSHGFPADSRKGHLRVEHGPFCKFSLDAARAPRGEEPLCTGPGMYYNIADPATIPSEGEAAMTRAASNSHLRNASCFTLSTTPSLGKFSSITHASFVSPEKVLCKTPGFAGILTNHRAVFRVHVTINGDFHDLEHLSISNANYTVYSPREARITTLERTGGPIVGGTYVRISGKLFLDFTQRNRLGHKHLLQCRFGAAGQTNATWQSESAVACFSPAIAGTGHRQATTVDLTYNGQDFLSGPNPVFTYSVLDRYVINGPCRNAFGGLSESGGLCDNNFTGIAVSELQPFGGPTLGGTRVVVLGRLFAVQGPAILCKFGDLDMVVATYVNETAVICESPANPFVNGSGFTDNFAEVTLNGETNFLTSSHIPFVYYDHNATLAVSSIYPQAGRKEGGNTITVYGTGFRVLGGKLVQACDGKYSNQSSAEEFYGPGRTEGALSRGLSRAVGDSRVCHDPLIDGTNRGLQCIFGDLPPVHAYLLQINASDPLTPPTPDAVEQDERVGTALICQSPPLPSSTSSYVPGQNDAEVFPGSPVSVCLEVTLNGNRSQSTRDCVPFIYYDT